MGNKGHQSFWITGSRLYVQRDPVESVIQPFLDLGRIAVANPSISPTKLELKDSDGGRLRVIDAAVSEIAEAYDITCSNLNDYNLSFLFLAEPPSSFVQSGNEVFAGTHWAIPGSLVKIVDSSGNNVYDLASIAAVYTGALTTVANTITAINAATKTITVGTDLTTPLDPGDHFIIHPDGLVNPLNAGTYTIVSMNATTITVAESFVANEANVTVDLSYEDTGTIYIPGTDWDIYHLSRGIIRMIDGGAFAVAANVKILYKPVAITGNRLILPLSLKDTSVRAKALLIWSRDDNAQQTAREFSITITPGSSAFSDTDYSNMVLNISAVTDLTAAAPSGKIIHFKGALPTSS